MKNLHIALLLLALLIYACSFQALPTQATSQTVLTQATKQASCAILHTFRGYHSKIAPKARHAEMLKMDHLWQVMK